MQWFTRSAPIGVVPAGHEGDLELRADAVGARDEHRILKPVAIEAEQAAERSDVREDAGRERRPRQRPDAAHRLVSGVDIDAGLTVVHQKSSFPIRVCIRLAGRRSLRRVPIGAAGGGEERFLVEILLEHVEAFGHELDGAIAIGVLPENRQHQRRIAQGNRSERQRHGCTRRIVARRNADLEQGVDRLIVAPGYGQGAEACRRAAQQFLESEVAIGELQRLDQIVLVRAAIHAEHTDRRGDGRLRLAGRRLLQRRQRRERALVPDLSERQRRIVLEGAVELRNLDERVVGVERLVVAERLDDGAPKIIFAAPDFPEQGLPERGSSYTAPWAASARTSEGRTNSPCSLSSAATRSPTMARSG